MYNEAQLTAMERRVVTQARKRLTVSEAVRVLRLVDEQHPRWSNAETLDALRRICTYDTSQWRTMVGGPGNPKKLEPGSKLSQLDYEHLVLMLSRGGRGRFGVVSDPGGKKINLAHVIAGLAAGERPKSSVSLSFVTTFFGVGSRVNNRYATTLSGDVGQSAALFKFGKSTARYGPGTDLTEDELLGDVDGLLMALNDKDFGGRLHEKLQKFYFTTTVAGANYRNRGHLAAYTLNWSTVLKESERFADTYKFKVRKRSVGTNMFRVCLDTLNDAKVALAALVPATAAEVRGIVADRVTRRGGSGVYVHKGGTSVTDTWYRKSGRRVRRWEVSFDEGKHWQSVSQQRLSYDFGGQKGHRVPALSNLRLMAFLAARPDTRLE